MIVKFLNSLDGVSADHSSSIAELLCEIINRPSARVEECEELDPGLSEELRGKFRLRCGLLNPGHGVGDVLE